MSSRGVLVLVFLLVFGFAGYSWYSGVSGSHISVAGGSMSIEWSVGFQGAPITRVVSVGGSFFVGTSLGLVELSVSGVERTIYLGVPTTDPVVFGDKVYLAFGDKLYSFGLDGSRSVELSAEGIKSLVAAGDVIVNIVGGSSSTVLFLGSGKNFVPGFIVDYMVPGTYGSVEGLALVSRLGNIVFVDLNTNLVYNGSVSLEEGSSEYVAFCVVGDFDGDSEGEIALAIDSMFVSDSSRLTLVDGGNITYYNLSGRITALGVYDFDGDGADDVFIGTQLWYSAYSFGSGSIFNVSLVGGEEGVNPPVTIWGDGSSINILYLSDKGSLVLADGSSTKAVYAFPNDPIETYCRGDFGEGDVFLVSRAGSVALVDSSQELREVASFGLLESPSSIIAPAAIKGVVSVVTEYGSVYRFDNSGNHNSLENISVGAQIARGDIDGDGNEELVFLSYDVYSTEVYVVEGYSDEPELFATIQDRVLGASMGDLDGNKGDELVLIGENKVYVVSPSKTITVDVGGELAPFPAPIMDIDNDGSLEAVVLRGDGTLYAINSSYVASKLFWLSSPPDAPLMVGDLNMDKKADYVYFRGASMYYVDSSGSIKAIVSKTNLTRNPYPVITDTDADGFLDVVTSLGDRLVVFDHGGREKKSFSFDTRILDFAVVDLGKDWIQDAVVLRDGALQVIDLVSGENVASELKSDLFGDVGYVLVGNFDDDEYAEFFVVSRGIVFVDTDFVFRGEDNGFGVNKYVNFDTMNYDVDGDGLSLLDEYVYGTDPYMKDTDGDGISDGVEIENGWDPLNPNSPARFPIFWVSLGLTIALGAGLAVYYFKFLRKKEEGSSGES